VPSIADFAFSTAHGLPLERHTVRQLEAGEERGVLAARVELESCMFSSQATMQHPPAIARSAILKLGPEVTLLDSQGQDGLMLANNGDLQYK